LAVGCCVKNPAAGGPAIITIRGGRISEPRSKGLGIKRKIFSRQRLSVCEAMLNMLNTPAKVNRKLIERQIRAKNVSDAMTETRPAGIDSCTPTNACDADGRPIRFRKDLGKVKHLVEAVRLTEEFLQ
jgi:hypothetical protein